MSNPAAKSFYNPCVAQHGAYIVCQLEEFRFSVLEPNPDAGKPGVCYAGAYLTVCTTDGLEAADQVARGLAAAALLAEYQITSPSERATAEWHTPWYSRLTSILGRARQVAA